MNKAFLAVFVVGVVALGLAFGGAFFVPSATADDPLPVEAPPIGSNKDTDGDNPMTPGCIATYDSAQCTTIPMNVSADYCFAAQGPDILAEFFATDAQGNQLAGGVCGPQNGAKIYDCDAECKRLEFAGGTCGTTAATSGECFDIEEARPALCVCTQ